MIWRSCYYAVLALLATAATVTQLDRQAFVAPALAYSVPAPFRAASQQRLVEASIATRDAENALDAARDLVRKRPMPAHNLVLYAGGAQLAGQDDQVIATLELAAQRGWREPVVQIAVARAGLLSGDSAATAQRVAALIAIDAPADQTDPLLAELVARDDGRMALASLLAGEGHWQRHFLPRLLRVATAEQFADTIRRAARQGARLDCAQLQAARDSLRQGGHVELAESIAQDGC